MKADLCLHTKLIFQREYKNFKVCDLYQWQGLICLSWKYGFSSVWKWTYFLDIIIKQIIKNFTCMWAEFICVSNILKPVLTYLNKEAVRQMKISICPISLTTDVTLLVYCLKNKKIFRARYSVFDKSWVIVSNFLKISKINFFWCNLNTFFSFL